MLTEGASDKISFADGHRRWYGEYLFRHRIEILTRGSSHTRQNAVDDVANPYEQPVEALDASFRTLQQDIRDLFARISRNAQDVGWWRGTR